MSDPLRFRFVADMPLIDGGAELFRTADGEQPVRGARIEIAINISQADLHTTPDPRRRVQLALEALVREFMRTHMPPPEPRMSLAQIERHIREGLKPRKD